MFDAGLTAESLRECLLDLPPLELLGMKLIQDTPHAGLFPSDVPRDTLKAAVIEVIEYGDRCQSAARRLSQLAPVPVAVDVWEFVL